jgi:SMC interacting uncharacterized protein involved in chromosome segregation
MDDLTRRNFLAVQQSINELNQKIQNYVDKIDKLQQNVTMMTVELQKLQQNVAVLKATSLGRGPTQ